MADNKQHDTRTTRRPDCVTEILSLIHISEPTRP